MRLSCSPGEADGLHLTLDDLRRAVAVAPKRTVERPGFRRSAVLVPFTCVDDEWHFVLTRRTEDLEHHKGQISFPGGAREEGEDATSTALREAREEIALDPSLVETLGEIDELWTPSKFVISPVVGIVRSVAGLVANPAEVSRIFTVPVAHFADERNAEMRPIHVNGYTRDVYFYRTAGETIWGATAFIIRGVISRLRLAGVL